MFTYMRGLERREFNCTEPAIDEFPSDGLTREQRTQGWLTIHILISLYAFTAMAIVCDEYFIPAVERLCVSLDMSTDIAGASFMAAATSAPEMFINVIGTFITEGDLGVGTIVGSAVFNTLGVAAVCGIVSGVTIKLDWWPLTRDCLVYSVAVSTLISILYTPNVHWYDALTLVIMYVFYLLVMIYDKSLQRFVKNKLKLERLPCFDPADPADATRDSALSKANETEYEDSSPHLWVFPHGESCYTKTVWCLQWPIYIAYCLTIPDCRKPNLRKLYPMSFLMCCFWISMLSYTCAWMITVVGDTFRIPDTVMGITFLAMGTSIPEAVSSVIVARRGYGSMAICNSIGSNTFDILLCLGIPWLIKTSFFPTTAGKHSLEINSSGLVYSTITLLSSLCLLYISFAITKFTLGRTVGFLCLTYYCSFLVLACLVEMNYFFQVNLPTCER